MFLTQNNNYTIRSINSEQGEIEKEVFDEIESIVSQTIFALGLNKSHLFITVVAGTAIQIAEEEEDYCFGLYMEKMHHIVLAGLIPEVTDDPEFTREYWFKELRSTIVHEIFHYKQDLEGILEDTEENERITEEMSQKLIERLT